jgi:hypothetical protein
MDVHQKKMYRAPNVNTSIKQEIFLEREMNGREDNAPDFAGV